MGGREADFCYVFAFWFQNRHLPRPGKAKVKNSQLPPLKVPCLLTGRDPHPWLWQFLPSLQSRLCRDKNGTAVWEASPCPMPCPAEGCLRSCGCCWLCSLWREGSEPSISCWSRIWVAQSRYDPQLPTCQGPPWENIHYLQISTNYLLVLHLQMGLIFF